MIRLPRLLLTANASTIAKVCAEINEVSDPVVCDASELRAAEPLALCAVAATLAHMQRFGRRVSVIGLQQWLKQHLQRLDILSHSLHAADEQSTSTNEATRSLHAYRIRDVRDGNTIGNALAQTVASLIPLPYVRHSERPRPVCHPLTIPLAYLFTELIDNAFSHGRARGYTHGTVWTSAQYFPPRGLIRLAVVDDGCGFHATLQGRRDLDLNSHADSIRAAFRPHVSCKRDVGLFADSVHQGLGLTICRDLATRASGTIAVLSGNAWISNPECTDEIAKATVFWQGSIVSAELQLSSLNTANFREITSKYTTREDLPIRFI